MSVAPNVSMTAARKPFTFKCDEWDCFWRTGHRTEEDAYIAQEQHRIAGCPRPARNYMLDAVDEKGQQYTKPTHGKSIAEKLWDELDAALDQLIAEQSAFAQASVGRAASTPEPMGIALLKGQCQAYAKALHTMLAVYYPTVDDVSKEAMTRRKIKRGTVDWRPTPGYAYNPPPPGTKTYREALKAAADAKAATPGKKAASVAGPTKPRRSFTQEQLNGIRSARDGGILTVAQLADSFKVSEEFINSL